MACSWFVGSGGLRRASAGGAAAVGGSAVPRTGAGTGGDAGGAGTGWFHGGPVGAGSPAARWPRNAAAGRRGATRAGRDGSATRSAGGATGDARRRTRGPRPGQPRHRRPLSAGAHCRGNCLCAAAQYRLRVRGAGHYSRRHRQGGALHSGRFPADQYSKQNRARRPSVSITRQFILNGYAEVVCGRAVNADGVRGATQNRILPGAATDAGIGYTPRLYHSRYPSVA